MFTVIEPPPKDPEPVVMLAWETSASRTPLLLLSSEMTSRERALTFSEMTLASCRLCRTETATLPAMLRPRVALTP